MSDDFIPSGVWKIDLTIKINFISSKDSGESKPMCTKSEIIEHKNYKNYRNIIEINIEIMVGNNANEIINERFSSLLTR